MLLRPRKFRFKNFQKKRSIVLNFKENNFIYGQILLKILQPLRLTSKHLFRFKLFLKKGAKRVDKTSRKVWINAFPHLPLTKKVLGSRMGKGKGKLAVWWVQLKPGLNLFEFKNTRIGRGFYFLKILTNKLLVKVKILSIYNKNIKSIYNKKLVPYESFL